MIQVQRPPDRPIRQRSARSDWIHDDDVFDPLSFRLKRFHISPGAMTSTSLSSKWPKMLSQSRHQPHCNETFSEGARPHASMSGWPLEQACVIGPALFSSAHHSPHLIYDLRLTQYHAVQG